MRVQIISIFLLCSIIFLLAFLEEFLQIATILFRFGSTIVNNVFLQLLHYRISNYRSHSGGLKSDSNGSHGCWLIPSSKQGLYPTNYHSWKPDYITPPRRRFFIQINTQCHNFIFRYRYFHCGKL